jgi:hypothetical protein
MLEIQIAAGPVRDQIPADKPLAERVAFAMRYVREHESDLFWMSYDANDDLKMQTALAAVMLAGNEEDREAIGRAMKPLKMLSAAMSGIPVDFTSLEDYADVLPLLKMWKESEVRA